MHKKMFRYMALGITIIFVVSIISIYPLTASAAQVGDEITVDNISSVFSKTGSWQLRNDLQSSYGSNCFTSVESSANAVWRPNVTTPGLYIVYITWPQMEASEASSIEIGFQGGAVVDTTKKVNQSVNGGYWVQIGTYYMTSGNGNYIKLKSNGQGIVCADAVKLVLSSDMTGQSAPVEANIINPLPFNYTEQVNILQDRTSKNFSLSVNGEPFYIKGMCNNQGMDKIKAAGGNTIRTYSSITSTTGAILDEAQRLGMKVVLGLWMNHETATFQYANNKDAVQSQLSNLKKQVDTFKNHPALLMWAVGNEVDITTSADMGAIQKAMNDVAGYIKTVDPYHPTTSVHAGSHIDKITGIRELAPFIDIVSFNSYKYIGNVYGNVNSALWQGAYMITEFSTDQPSELGSLEKTSWAAVIERTDILKAADYKNRYLNYIYGKKDKCLGSFAFAAYGAYRGTHTWYNVFLEQNYLKTTIYDALYECWNGQSPQKKAPSVTSIYIDNKQAKDNIIINSGEACTANVDIINDGGEAVVYKYEIRRNSMDYIKEPMNIIFSFDPQNKAVAMFNAPYDAGEYRLYCYVYDGLGNVGTANIPFKVENGTSTVSKVLAEESFNYTDGTPLDSISADLNKGWTGGWYADKELTNKVTGKYTIAKNKLDYTTASYTDSLSLYRSMRDKIDFDSDSEYYTSWIMKMNAPVSGGYNIQKLDLIGTTSIAVGVMNDADSKTELHPILKIGSGTTAYDTGYTINLGQYYKVILNIKAVKSGNDMLRVKIFPNEMQEPEKWNFDVSQAITGYCNIAGLVASPNRLGIDIVFDDLVIEYYNLNDSDTIKQSELLIGNMLASPDDWSKKQEIEDLLLILNDGIAKKSIKNRLNLTIPYVTEHNFYVSGTRIFKKQTGLLTCKANIVNQTSIEQPMDLFFAVAVYNSKGSIASISISSVLAHSIKAYDTYELSTDFVIGSDSDTVKSFVFKDIERLIPYTNSYVLTQNGIISAGSI